MRKFDLRKVGTGLLAVTLGVLMLSGCAGDNATQNGADDNTNELAQADEAGVEDDANNQGGNSGDAVGTSEDNNASDDPFLKDYDVVIIGGDEASVIAAEQIAGDGGSEVLIVGMGEDAPDTLSDGIEFTSEASVYNIIYDGDGVLKSVNIKLGEDKINIGCNALILSTYLGDEIAELTGIYKISEKGLLATTASGMLVRKESDADVPTKCGVPLVDPEDMKSDEESFGVDLLSDDNTWSGSRVYAIGIGVSGAEGDSEFMIGEVATEISSKVSAGL